MEKKLKSFQIKISGATLRDVAAIKRLADSSKRELGFVLKPAVIESIRERCMLVARIEGKRGVLGFIRFHHRLDKVTKVYEVCVNDNFRKCGLGRVLLNTVEQLSQVKGQAQVSLKCPEGLSANSFYVNCGYCLESIESGKRRRLCVWVRRLAS